MEVPPPQTLGHFTQVFDGPEVTSIEPVWKFPNREQIQGINAIDRELRLLCCDMHTEVPRSSTSITPLQNFLERNNELQITGPFEYNVICRASALYKSLVVNFDSERKTEVEAVFKFWDIGSKATVALEEKSDLNGVPPEPKFSDDCGLFAEKALSRTATNIEKLKGLHLYVVVKHQFRYDNGTKINLFVSKEIDSVMENDVNKAIDYKVIPFHNFGYAENLARRNKDFIMDYLANGITYVFGTRKNSCSRFIERVTFMEDISGLCKSIELESFKEKLEPFLYSLVKSNIPHGAEITNDRKKVFWIDESKELETKRILATVIQPRYEIYTNIAYPPDHHHLLILGKYQKPLDYKEEYCLADIISLTSFCEHKYEGFLKKPTEIILFGTNEEYMQVKQMIELVGVAIKFVDADEVARERARSRPRPMFEWSESFYEKYFKWINLFEWFRR